VKDLFVWEGGNLDALGGLSPQAGTLGQEELLNASASERVLDMQEITQEATRDVIRHLMWYRWTDPVRRTVYKPITGSERTIRTTWSPQTREGDFLDYTHTIEPYSMTSVSPRQKVTGIMNAIERIVLPFQEQLAAQGKALDVDKVLGIVAKYGNTPELAEIMGSAPVEPSPRTQETPTRAPNTTRTNIRRSVPGASRAGRDDVMTRTLLGGIDSVQPAERAQLTR
jgi:hypothetical protein